MQITHGGAKATYMLIQTSNFDMGIAEPAAKLKTLATGYCRQSLRAGMPWWCCLAVQHAAARCHAGSKCSTLCGCCTVSLTTTQSTPAIIPEPAHSRTTCGTAAAGVSNSMATTPSANATTHTANFISTLRSSRVAPKSLPQHICVTVGPDHLLFGCEEMQRIEQQMRQLAQKLKPKYRSSSRLYAHADAPSTIDVIHAITEPHHRHCSRVGQN
jgi:hypothetical protein